MNDTPTQWFSRKRGNLLLFSDPLHNKITQQSYIYYKNFLGMKMSRISSTELSITNASAASPELCCVTSFMDYISFFQPLMLTVESRYLKPSRKSLSYWELNYFAKVEEKKLHLVELSRFHLKISCLSDQ